MSGHIIHLPKGAKITKDGKLVVPKYYPTVSAAIAAKKKKTWKAAK